MFEGVNFLVVSKIAQLVLFLGDLFLFPCNTRFIKINRNGILPTWDLLLAPLGLLIIVFKKSSFLIRDDSLLVLVINVEKAESVSYQISLNFLVYLSIIIEAWCMIHF